MAQGSYRKRLPSAVAFTHFGSLNRGVGNIEDYKPIFQRYLECNREESLLSIVYIFIDYALHAVVSSRPRKKKSNEIIFINPEVLQEEAVIINQLQAVEAQCRLELHMTTKLPCFVYVGINSLIILLNSIRDIDNSLVQYLAGPSGKFTYDSPKFVEAIIRIARGNHPFLAVNPIIRIDEDAEPNGQSIKKLIESYMGMKNHSFFFFSGSYGDINGGYDPINDHAVRTHWFFPIGTKKGSGGKQVIYPPGTTQDQIASILKMVSFFLSDLTELGGKQHDGTYSQNLQNIINNRKEKKISTESPQVISGAGLIMNHKAVSLLPPFMNFATLTTWVDDHIKRSLHEAIGDIKPSALLSITEAKFWQNRHPEGIRCDKDRDDYVWAKQYLERLLRGCLLDRIVMQHDRSATEYSSWIGQITKFKNIRKITSVQKDFKINPAINVSSNHPLVPTMLKQTCERYDEVISCWKSSEFTGTLLFDWANSMDNNTERERICSDIIKDALAYIDLVLVWPTFRSAIMRLDVMSNFWLFRDMYPED